MGKKPGFMKFGAVSAFGGAAVLLGAGSAAWACVGGVPRPFLDAPQPQQATAGSQVQLRGGNWGTAPVQVKWEGAGGPQLAQFTPEQDGSFLRSVTIPSAATPGFFDIVASKVGDGEVMAANRIEVKVATPSGQQGDGGVQPEPQGNPNLRTSSGSNGAVAQRQQATAPGADNGAGTATAPAPAGLQPQAGSGAVTNPFVQAAAADGSTPQAPVVQAAPADGSTPQGAVGTSLAEPQQAQAPAATPDAPSRDLWSGFQDGLGRSSGDQVNVPSSASSSLLPVGMAVFVGGLVSMLAGFAVAEMRRRRSLA